MDWLRDTGRLRAFLTVAESGSFTAAARRLGQSQPTVSSLVAALEERIGTPLFVRGRGGARLTPAGEALRPHAVALLGVAEDARRAIDAAAGGARRHLRIGGGEVLMTYLLPAALARLERSLPQLTADFLVADEVAVLRALHERRIELALVTDRAPATGLDLHPFAEDELVLLVPAGHALGASAAPRRPHGSRAARTAVTGRGKPQPAGGRAGVDLSVLAGETLVVREAGAVDRREAERLLDAASVVPARRLVAHTLEAVKQSVGAGLGVALVPGAAVCGDEAALRALALGESQRLTYCLAHPAGPAPALAEPLLAALRSHDVDRVVTR